MCTEIAVELMLPSPTAIPCSLFAFVKVGRGESLLYGFLHFTAANYCSRGVLQDMWQLQAFTHYYSNINFSAITRLYPTLGYFCYKSKCMWLAFCSLVPLLHLYLFRPHAETAFLGLPSLWDFLEMAAFLAEALSVWWIHSFELRRHHELL